MLSPGPGAWKRDPDRKTRVALPARYPLQFVGTGAEEQRGDKVQIKRSAETGLIRDETRLKGMGPFRVFIETLNPSFDDTSPFTQAGSAWRDEMVHPACLSS